MFNLKGDQSEYPSPWNNMGTIWHNGDKPLACPHRSHDEKRLCPAIDKLGLLIIGNYSMQSSVPFPNSPFK